MPHTLENVLFQLDLCVNRINELEDSVRHLQNQDLNKRIKELDDRLDAQALDYQEKLTRLAQVVAELSTR